MKGVGESERHCKLETPLPTSTCTVFQQPPLFKILSQSALAKKEKTTLHYTTTTFVQHFKRNVQALIAQNKNKVHSQIFW